MKTGRKQGWREDCRLGSRRQEAGSGLKADCGWCGCWRGREAAREENNTDREFKCLVG